MSIKDALLATIDAQVEPIRGRTLLQKKLYFLSVLSREDFGYSPHYYGPYSPQVADELGALVDAGLVVETVETFPQANGPFGDRRRFNYSLSKGGKSIVASDSESIHRFVKQLPSVNNHAIANDPHLLSIAAKVHFIVSEDGKTTVEGIRNRAKALGWDISNEDINQVVDYLRTIFVG